MYLPSFRHLIEIEALKGQNQNDLSSIAGEEKRISDLSILRAKREAHSSTLSDELKSLKLIESQLEIESLELKIRRTREQIDILSSEKELKAMTQQLDTMSADLGAKEENYFKNLERSEEIALEKKEIEDFLRGSLKTLDEITKEVALDKDKFQLQISNRNLRIQSLEEQTDKSLLKFYHEIEKKFAGKKPVAYLLDKKCSACFIQVDSMFKTALEEGRSMEACPNCGRFLIPETAKIY